jgi:hypothetical protein
MSGKDLPVLDEKDVRLLNLRLQRHKRQVRVADLTGRTMDEFRKVAKDSGFQVIPQLVPIRTVVEIEREIAREESQ